MPKKKTKEEFIVDARKIHGIKYDYSLVEYINNHTKVKIICKEHGIFKQTPSDHTNAKSNCQKCGLIKLGNLFKKSKEEFIVDARKIHGIKYDYSLVEYINNHTKVKIICKEHGIFKQAPADHIGKQAGCSLCYGNVKSSTKQFIVDARKIHGIKYDYSLVEYINNHTKVKIICKEHGIFEQAPKPHIIEKHGCCKCGNIETGVKARKSVEQFNVDSREVHGNKYDYSLVEYINNQTKVKIICKEHGIFKQSPTNHIHGKQGCMECWNVIRPGGCGGYTQCYFDSYPKLKTVVGLLYVIEMAGNKEHFVKVGITKRTIKERYSCTGMGDKHLSKKVIHEIPMTLYDAWLLEQRILNELKDYRYFPNFDFNGKTECLKPKTEVFNHIEELVVGAI